MNNIRPRALWLCRGHNVVPGTTLPPLSPPWGLRGLSSGSISNEVDTLENPRVTHGKE
ncbi:hypothetical protein BaRGS_00008159, partial [Batillaria attramentaria]